MTGDPIEDESNRRLLAAYKLPATEKRQTAVDQLGEVRDLLLAGKAKAILIDDMEIDGGREGRYRSLVLQYRLVKR